MITIDEFKKKYATRSRLIGIDLGSKRIGIGISDEYRKIATPYKTINKTTIDDLIKQLKEIRFDKQFSKNDFWKSSENSY